MKKILSLAVTSFLLTGTFFSSVPAKRRGYKRKTEDRICRCRMGFCKIK